MWGTRQILSSHTPAYYFILKSIAFVALGFFYADFFRGGVPNLVHPITPTKKECFFYNMTSIKKNNLTANNSNQQIASGSRNEQSITLHTIGNTTMVSAQEIHQRLGAGKLFRVWWRDRIKQLDLIENVHYIRQSKGVGYAVYYYVTMRIAQALALYERTPAAKPIWHALINSDTALPQAHLTPGRSVSLRPNNEQASACNKPLVEAPFPALPKVFPHSLSSEVAGHQVFPLLKLLEIFQFSTKTWKWRISKHPKHFVTIKGETYCSRWYAEKLYKTRDIICHRLKINHAPLSPVSPQLQLT